MISRISSVWKFSAENSSLPVCKERAVTNHWNIDLGHWFDWFGGCFLFVIRMCKSIGCYSTNWIRTLKPPDCFRDWWLIFPMTGSTSYPRPMLKVACVAHFADSIKSSFVSGQLGLEGAVLLELALQVRGVAITLVLSHLQLLVDPSTHLDKKGKRLAYDTSSPSGGTLAFHLQISHLPPPLLFPPVSCLPLFSTFSHPNLQHTCLLHQSLCWTVAMPVKPGVSFPFHSTWISLSAFLKQQLHVCCRSWYNIACTKKVRTGPSS